MEELRCDTESSVIDISSTSFNGPPEHPLLSDPPMMAISERNRYQNIENCTFLNKKNKHIKVV